MSRDADHVHEGFNDSINVWVARRELGTSILILIYELKALINVSCLREQNFTHAGNSRQHPR